MDKKIAEIDALIQQAENIKFTDFNICLELSKKALQLAKEIDYPKGIADGLFYMGISKYASGAFDDALSDLEKALNKYKTFHDRQGQADCLLRIGATYLLKTFYDEALEHLQKSLDIFNEIGDKKGQVSAKGNIANIYSQQAYDDLALKYYLEILKSFREIKDKRGEALTLLNISRTYSGQAEFEKALDCFLQSLQISKFLKMEELQAVLLLNIGSTYIELKQPEKALLYLKQSSKLRSKIGLDDDGYCIMNMGRAYEQKKCHENALSFFKKSLIIFKQANDADGQALVHVLMGLTFLEKEELDQAIENFDTTVCLLEGAAKTSTLENAHFYLAEAYKKKKNPTKALEYFEKYDKLRDKKISEKTNKHVRQLQIIFEVEQKEKELEIYRLKNEQQNKELTLLAKNLFDKNKLLNELQKKITSLDNENIESKEELIAFILSYLRNINSAEGGWHTFEEQFDKIHPDFISYLSQAYPGLTRQELTVCALIKLNLSSREIAKILYVIPRTVEVYRNRIRKKLDISRKTPLKLFLSAL